MIRCTVAYRLRAGELRDGRQVRDRSVEVVAGVVLAGEGPELGECALDIEVRVQFRLLRLRFIDGAADVGDESGEDRERRGITSRGGGAGT